MIERLQNDSKAILSLDDNSIVDRIFLHCVYMTMKTKMGLKACVRYIPWGSDFPGWTRTRDLPINRNYDYD
jgi:hypothetical protein